MDFEQIYKLKVKHYKEPIFFSIFTVLTVWTINSLSAYSGCLKLSKDVCPTAYLYIPSNSYHNVGTLGLYILLAVLVFGMYSGYRYFKTGKLPWYKLIIWGIILLYLKYFITATTLY